MGNLLSTSTNYDNTSSEMSSAKHFSKGSTRPGPVYTLDQLQQLYLSLRQGISTLSDAVDDIFDYQDDEVEAEDPIETERRLQEMARSNQELIKKLTRDLDSHSKLVNEGQGKNELLMVMVKNLVSTVNDYMATLIRNIRKLKRLVSKMEAKRISRVGSLDLSDTMQRRSLRKKDSGLIYDVISDHQDVDTMLIQLVETEAQREELESDIVTVLVFWGDYRQFFAREMEGSGQHIDKIEEKVLDAADSVHHGLFKLNKSNA